MAKERKKEGEIKHLKKEVEQLKRQLVGEQSANRFRLVVESAPNGIIVADEEGNIIMVNRKAEEMFGYNRDEFCELKIEALIPDRFSKGHAKLRQGFVKAPEIRQMGAGRDLYALDKEGTEFPIEIGLTPLPEGDRNLILCAVVDITERKTADDALRFQSEIFRNVHDAIFYLLEDGTILDWNEGAERIFKVSANIASGRDFYSLIDPISHEPFRERLLPRIDRFGSAEEVIRCLLNGESDKVTLRTKGTRLDQNGQKGYVICASNITDQKKLEAKIVSISENEQRRIGQDLHDDLCSQLSGIACMTKAMESRFLEHQKEEAEMMARVSEMVSDAVTKARQIAKGLVPAALENQGLKSALEELVANTCDIFGVNCQLTRCESQITESLPMAIATQVYRIVQEAITNAVKHSDANLIEVTLHEIEPGVAEVCVRDDGRGMPADLVSAGLGLLTMRQRAELIGAEFDIHANPGDGTRITCRVSKDNPMQEDE